MAKSRLIIDIDRERKTITVTDEDGTQVTLESLVLLGGDAPAEAVLIKMIGASADAAWAYAQGFRIAHQEGGGVELKSFYKQCAAHICQMIDPDMFRNMADVNKWECEDQSRWGGWDSEDVLEDKQLAEAKKRWN